MSPLGAAPALLRSPVLGLADWRMDCFFVLVVVVAMLWLVLVLWFARTDWLYKNLLC